MTPSDILRRLAGLHHGPVPNQLESQIKAWSRHYGTARMREAMLLEVRDSTIADELLADEQLATMLMRFGDESQGNVLLVQTENTELLRRLLRQRGVDLI
jgi:hypothetical protein